MKKLLILLIISQFIVSCAQKTEITISGTGNILYVPEKTKILISIDSDSEMIIAAEEIFITTINSLNNHLNTIDSAILSTKDFKTMKLYKSENSNPFLDTSTSIHSSSLKEVIGYRISSQIEIQFDTSDVSDELIGSLISIPNLEIKSIDYFTENYNEVEAKALGLALIDTAEKLKALIGEENFDDFSIGTLREDITITTYRNNWDQSNALIRRGTPQNLEMRNSNTSTYIFQPNKILKSDIIVVYRK